MSPLSLTEALDYVGVVRSHPASVAASRQVAMDGDVVQGAVQMAAGNSRQRQSPRRSNEALRPSARTPVWFGEGAYG